MSESSPTERQYYCHPQALVESQAIGAGSRIWAFAHVLPGATIGTGCNICDHCFVENKVTIGNDVTLKCGVYLWDGIVLEDNVFVGPNVVFTNDVRPRSKNAAYALLPTVVQAGASLGANSTILAGVTIGRYALTGIGAVVTRDVPAYALVYGNPARQHGWVDEQGDKLQPVPGQPGRWHSPATGAHYQETAAGLTPAPNAEAAL
ncbi:acyltransferase [Hymenobacter armeniacus]|uniref:N-acetyltransferase n=1 Tax=Hymenobacter armeniacus TaxID=2771358 RepID=A0ABR8JP56_9BACT|nr:acyltransferase [Hymenobacter armeniacus]MBD2721785.1 N-acetyltransferase [Hymenobacter armeniacus]